MPKYEIDLEFEASDKDRATLVYNAIVYAMANELGHKEFQRTLFIEDTVPIWRPLIEGGPRE